MHDDFDMDGFGAGPFGKDKLSKKVSKSNKFMDIGGRNTKDPFEGPKKKGRGRPAGTSGHVANVFYDSQLPPTSQPLDADPRGPTPGSDVDAFVGNELDPMDGVVDNSFSRQESETEVCAVCMKFSYIPSGGTALEDINVIWIQCGKCLKWYHAPCKGVDPSTIDENKDWYCCQSNAE